MFANVITSLFVTSAVDVQAHKHSPSRFLSAFERLDMFAVKVGMTEPLFVPGNVKREGHTWQDKQRDLKDFAVFFLFAQKKNNLRENG